MATGENRLGETHSRGRGKGKTACIHRYVHTCALKSCDRKTRSHRLAGGSQSLRERHEEIRRRCVRAYPSVPPACYTGVCVPFPSRRGRFFPPFLARIFLSLSLSVSLRSLVDELCGAREQQVCKLSERSARRLAQRERWIQVDWRCWTCVAAGQAC